MERNCEMKIKLNDVALGTLFRLNWVKLMLKHAPGWVRTSDLVNATSGLLCPAGTEWRYLDYVSAMNAHYQLHHKEDNTIVTGCGRNSLIISISFSGIIHVSDNSDQKTNRTKCEMRLITVGCVDV